MAADSTSSAGTFSVTWMDHGRGGGAVESSGEASTVASFVKDATSTPGLSLCSTTTLPRIGPSSSLTGSSAIMRIRMGGSARALATRGDTSMSNSYSSAPTPASVRTAWMPLALILAWSSHRSTVACTSSACTRQMSYRRGYLGAGLGGSIHSGTHARRSGAAGSCCFTTYSELSQGGRSYGSTSGAPISVSALRYTGNPSPAPLLAKVSPA
mmetsp:Transcript_21399/g.43552  ORF Transcript_21399/g.43552 Transcript_21399/m.43552 type:complete len:212 (+) Transcript_21399:130-765(+)